MCLKHLAQQDFLCISKALHWFSLGCLMCSHFIDEIRQLKAPDLCKIESHVADSWDKYRYKITYMGLLLILCSFEREFFYSGIRTFNSLSNETVEGKNNKSHFREDLRRYIVSHSFYSLEEFLHQSEIIRNIDVHHWLVFSSIFIANFHIF